MKYEYIPRGVCSQSIVLDMDGETIKSVRFYGGCNGNLKGLGAMAAGMNANDVIKRVEGITCGMKKTSCPDQLAKALKEYLAASAGK